MSLSQKCQYAVRAVFELAKRGRRKPVTISEIADAQAIPPRFLEVILGQLRQGGFVESRRGVQGGYTISAAPQDLSVGEIIRFIDGPVDPVKCTTEASESRCALHGRCAFIHLWERARDALAGVYDGTTFQDLLDDEAACVGDTVADYCI